MKQIGIYKITCKGNNKIYIGSSKNIKYRWQVHLSELRGNRHHSTYLQRSFNKYGEESFEFSVLLEMFEYNEELLRMIEWYYIEELKPAFNIASPVVYNNTLEWRHKISESTKKLYTEKGYVNPCKNTGNVYNVYDIFGNKLYSNKHMPELEELFPQLGNNCYNYIKKYNGMYCSSKYNVLITFGELSFNTIKHVYKNTNFNNKCLIYDLEGNSYSRVDYYKKSRPHKGKAIYYRDIYKEIMNSENLYVIKENKIFTLPFLCHFIQKCISNNP